jgi:glycosyltransferase involved in cell wall biosynthesis
MKVSACIITYNHENYIIDCLEGALSQKVNFDYEIVIGEDKSTDATLKICEEYASRYPDKIRLIKRDVNLGMMGNWIDTIKSCQGKYIAICEGDDYWTDPLKLQKQVDFMNTNAEFSICFTDYKEFYENKKSYGHPELIYKFKDKSTFSRNDIILNNFIPTLTVLFRNKQNIIDYLKKDFFPVDWFVHILNSKYGKIKFLPFESAVYRIHDGGVCSSSEPIFNNRRYLKSIDLFKSQFKYDYSLQILLALVKSKIRLQTFKIKLKNCFRT